MTRERAKELLPIIQAFVEGKAIQVQAADDSWNDWTKDPDFSWSNEWRIKPITEYRPFKTIEEVELCYGKAIKSYNVSALITGCAILEDKLCIYIGIDSTLYYTPEYLFGNFVFIGGNPVGIKE